MILELDAQSIKKKYGLSDNKKALVVFPKLEFVHSSDVSKIYSFLKKMNYEIIVKSSWQRSCSYEFNGR